MPYTPILAEDRRIPPTPGLSLSKHRCTGPIQDAATRDDLDRRRDAVDGNRTKRDDAVEGAAKGDAVLRPRHIPRPQRGEFPMPRPGQATPGENTEPGAITGEISMKKTEKNDLSCRQAP